MLDVQSWSRDMGTSVIVWDIETVPDLKGFAAANYGNGEDDVRAAMGDKFPKHIYHSIICIGALVAHQGLTSAHLPRRVSTAHQSISCRSKGGVTSPAKAGLDP
jgi:hypothetical protein